LPFLHKAQLKVLNPQVYEIHYFNSFSGDIFEVYWYFVRKQWTMLWLIPFGRGVFHTNNKPTVFSGQKLGTSAQISMHKFHFI